MHACESLSLASCRARASRLFSRASHSASTRSPKRSSKARAVMSAWCCCSVHAAAMAVSLSAWSFSSVGAVSIGAPFTGSRPGPARVRGRGEGERRRGRERCEPVEAVLEDRIDVAIGAGLDGAGPGARRFEPLPAVALGQAQDAEARAIALLGMRTVREDRLDQGGRLGADRARPVDEARRRPLQMALVRLWHVGRVGGVLPADDTPPMRGDALAAVEDLDGGRGQAGVDVFMNERVGDGVVMAVELDVVVEADASADLPVAVDEGFGGEWPKGGLVQSPEELAATGPVEPHRPGVEIREELGNPRVERGEGEEGLVTEASEDPPLRDLHGDFDLRLVSRLRWPRRQDDGAVVQREFVIGPLHARLVAARDDDATFELIGHDGRGDAAKELEGALVARDPIRDLLGARRFRVGVVRGAEHGDKELDLDHLAGGGFDDLRLLAGVVDEALLAGAMDLAHRQAAALEPAPVDFAELGVAVAVRMLLEIFEMEQLEGDAGLAPLGMQVGAVGNGPMMRGWGRGPVHPGLQHLVAEGVDLSPIEPGRAGPQHRGADGAAADPQALRHLAVGAPEAPLLSQDLPCLAHGQSLGRHPSPFRGRTVRPTVPRRYASAIALITMPRSR